MIQRIQGNRLTDQEALVLIIGELPPRSEGDKQGSSAFLESAVSAVVGNMLRIMLDDLGELYHSYAIFGAHGCQLPGIFPINQYCKMPIINAYIQLAIAKCRTRLEQPVTFSHTTT